MVTRSTTVAGLPSLQRVTGHGPLRGFANLFANESRRWWHTRLWLVHLLVWVGIINGLIGLITFGLAQEPPTGDQPPVYEVLHQVFFQVGAMAIAIGVVIAAQGAIVGEKQLGTAAWVLSKPATRHAFVLAKFTTITLGFLVLAIVLPSILFFGQIMFATGRVPPLGRFLAGGAVMLLHMLFYLALALLVGSFAHSRGPVAGTALGFLFAGVLVPDLLPQSAVVFPWKLADIAGGLALGGALPATWSISVIATALWTVLFIGVALWRFGREEF